MIPCQWFTICPWGDNCLTEKSHIAGSTYVFVDLNKATDIIVLAKRQVFLVPNLFGTKKMGQKFNNFKSQFCPQNFKLKLVKPNPKGFLWAK